MKTEDRLANIYKLPAEEVYGFGLLETSPDGLSKEEARRRLEKFGHNEIAEVKKRPLVFKFLDQFIHLFALLLWVGSALSFIANMPELGWAIIAVIIINAIFSFWQEFKADKATEALKRLIAPNARVIREGEIMQIPARDLVPGDILVLEEGDIISADGRLVEEFELRTNNATLTGESIPVRKIADPILEETLQYLEIPNLVFSGTNVASGTGKAIITHTGMTTEFGKIASLTQAVAEEQSPLQKEIVWVTKIVAVLAIGMGIFFFFLGGFVGMPFFERFLFAIGIIVANVPEGLLPTVTLALALGVQRMARQKALVKKLSSVEALGCTTVICSDKTGTLTKNEMTVREIFVNNKRLSVSGVGYEPKGDFFAEGQRLSATEFKELELFFCASALCNNARLLPPSNENNFWSILGDPTEASLLVLAAKSGLNLDELRRTEQRVYLFPFESVRKRMTSIHKKQEKRIAYVKGASKETLQLCTHIYIDGDIKPLSQELRDEILRQNDSFAKGALRVLAVAFRELPADLTELSVETVEKGLVFLGLAAMMDPPHPEVEKAVKSCHTAGIRVVMITGDYGLTAESIARKIGIIKGKECRIITGSELNQMSDEDLIGTIYSNEVIFARVAPEHKMRVVSALKKRGEIVAVTGDGVNDAPALRQSDIGVAMGIAGTDVAKEASEILLLNDNFATIVKAIEEGRAIYANIKRFVTYIFASNVPEIIPFIIFVLSGGRIPLPLTVMQILAVDLGTDMLPAIALGMERPEPGIMERPPRSRKKRLVDLPLLLRAYGFLGIIETVACIAGFFWVYWSNGWRPGMEMVSEGLLYKKATTMTLAGIIATQIANVFACRTERVSIFKIGLFSNRMVLLGILVEIFLINLFIYVNPFQKVFGLAPIGLKDWAFLFMFTPILFFAEEIRKLIMRYPRR